MCGNVINKYNIIGTFLLFVSFVDAFDVDNGHCQVLYRLTTTASAVKRIEKTLKHAEAAAHNVTMPITEIADFRLNSS